jgi:hypothetical protein
MEWKVTLNNKAVIEDTESDVVVSSGCYWRLVLQNRLDQVVRRKFGDRRLRHDDTAVVVSVTQRSTPPFTKRYDETKIN